MPMFRCKMKRLDTGDITTVMLNFEPKIGAWYLRSDGIVEVFHEVERIEDKDVVLEDQG
jgi:hypothetical protein